MNSLMKKLGLATILAGIITACSTGGDDVAGIGGSGYVSTGSVSGFGSVFVNGIEFHTDSSTVYEIEDQLLYDQSQEQTYLSVGMVVQVEGTVDLVNGTGTATKIRYGDSLQGPITSSITNPDGNELHFTVMDAINVVAHVNNTVYSPADLFTTLNSTNLIEISGYYDQAGTLHATYIERKESVFNPSSHTVELEGRLVGINSPTDPDFTIQGVNIDANGAPILGLPNGLQEGLYVEVKGLYNTTDNTFYADEIEGEDIILTDGGDGVSIEGYITDYTDINSQFKVNGYTVDASSATLELKPATLVLRNGIQVEVEGNVVGGVLVADEIEVEGGDAEIHASIEGVPGADSFALRVVSAPEPVITVNITSETEFEDERDGTEPFGITDLADTDFVEVVGVEETGNTVTATKVRRVTSGEVILQGDAKAATIDGPAPNTGTITILGVTFDFVAVTDFENESDVILSNTEIDSLISGIGSTTPELLKIKDTDGDGVAEEVDQED